MEKIFNIIFIKVCNCLRTPAQLVLKANFLKQKSVIMASLWSTTVDEIQCSGAVEVSVSHLFSSPKRISNFDIRSISGLKYPVLVASLQNTLCKFPAYLFWKCIITVKPRGIE